LTTHRRVACALGFPLLSLYLSGLLGRTMSQPTPFIPSMRIVSNSSNVLSPPFTKGEALNAEVLYQRQYQKNGSSNTDLFNGVPMNQDSSYEVDSLRVANKANTTLNYYSENSKGLFYCSFPGCVARFSTIANKERHERTHTGQKPFVCELGCGKAFTRKHDMKTHLRVHTGEKPYQCNVTNCNKRFTRSSSLREHERNVHHLPQNRQLQGEMGIYSGVPSSGLPSLQYKYTPTVQHEPPQYIPPPIRMDHSGRAVAFPQTHQQPHQQQQQQQDNPEAREFAALVQKFQTAKQFADAFKVDGLVHLSAPGLPQPDVPKLPISIPSSSAAPRQTEAPIPPFLELASQTCNITES